jgi:hypothetical protein
MSFMVCNTLTIHALQNIRLSTMHVFEDLLHKCKAVYNKRQLLFGLSNIYIYIYIVANSNTHTIASPRDGACLYACLGVWCEN